MTELGKLHIKTRGGAGGNTSDTLIIQETGHFSFIHSQIIEKMGIFSSSSLLSWYSNKQTTRRERNTRGPFYSCIYVQKCSTKV